MSFGTILSGRPFFLITLLSIGITLLVGILDHITGYEISFSIFYILPIGLASWNAGRTPGLFLSIFSAFTWFMADVFSGHAYSHQAIPVWNAGVRLGFFVVIALLLAKIKTTLQAKQEMADIDGLTSLLNGRAFRESTTRLLALSKRMNRPVTLTYIDLDNFKLVNDTLGHSEGDRVLRVISSVLVKSLRSTDNVGRLGGDEFAIALPNTDRSQAENVIDKMHKELMKEVSRYNWPIGFSIGVMTFAIPPVSADDAIRHVDQLMYRVKKTGKNNVLFEDFRDTLTGESS